VAAEGVFGSVVEGWGGVCKGLCKYLPGYYRNFIGSGLCQPMWGAMRGICKMSWRMLVLYGLFVGTSGGIVWIGVGDWVRNRLVEMSLSDFAATFTSIALPAVCILQTLGVSGVS